MQRHSSWMILTFDNVSKGECGNVHRKHTQQISPCQINFIILWYHHSKFIRRTKKKFVIIIFHEVIHELAKALKETKVHVTKWREPCIHKRIWYHDTIFPKHTRIVWVIDGSVWKLSSVIWFFSFFIYPHSLNIQGQWQKYMLLRLLANHIYALSIYLTWFRIKILSWIMWCSYIVDTMALCQILKSKHRKDQLSNLALSYLYVVTTCLLGTMSPHLSTLEFYKTLRTTHQLYTRFL